MVIKMKKLFALVLALVMSLCLVACGSGTSEGGGSTSDGPVEIVWWTNYGASNVDLIQTRIDAFNESQSKYHVTIERQGGAAELKAKLASTDKANLPDMFSGTPSTTYYYIKNGFTLPLQQFIDADKDDWTKDLYTPVRNLYSDVEGNMVGYPFGVSCIGLWVNVDALNAAGYQTSALTSYAKIAEAADAIVSKGIAPTGIAYFKDGQLLTDMLTMQGVEIVDGGNGRTGESTKCLYTEGATASAVTEAMDIFSGLYQSGSAYAYGSDVNGEIIPMFAGGSVGMFYGTNSYAGKLMDSNTDVNYTFLPLTGVNDNAAYQGSVLPAGTGNYIADTGNTEKEQGAYEFIKFLAQDEHQAFWCEKTGYIPYTSTCAAFEEYATWSKTNFPAAEEILTAMLNSDPNLKLPYLSIANEMVAANVTLMSNVATGSSSVTDAITTAAQSVDEALEIAALG
jgi:sn-glycerol 3-phosphate transport system substrate-binding protein